MKTMILAGLITLATMTVEAEVKKKIYSMTIDIAGKKANGKSWDMFGGSPDIKVLIDGEAYFSVLKCQDTYRCSIEFISTDDKWYIEVYDRDIQNDDLVAKGDCKVREECKLGLATVSITDQAHIVGEKFLSIQVLSDK